MCVWYQTWYNRSMHQLHCNCRRTKCTCIMSYCIHFRLTTLVPCLAGVAGNETTCDLTKEGPDDNNNLQRVEFESCRAFPAVPASESVPLGRWREETSLIWVDLQNAVEAQPNNTIVFKSAKEEDEHVSLYLSLHSIQFVLRPGAWVDDLFVDQALRLVTNAHPRTRLEGGACKFACIPYFTLEMFRTQGQMNTSTALSHDLRSARHVFCALHTPGHWSLVYVDLTGHKMHLFDTLAHTVPSLLNSMRVFGEASLQVAAVLRHHGVDVANDDWSCGVVQTTCLKGVRVVRRGPRMDVSKEFTCPTQLDSYNCSMYVCAIAECLAWGKDPLLVSSMDMDTYRKHLVWMMWHWHTHHMVPGWVSGFCKHAI
jgi:hypothetical protein